MATKKNAAAVELGRRGGQKKVAKGFSFMDPERRAEIAKKAAATRWKNKKKKATKTRAS
ncbi:MAG: KGG domain-containing protein [Ignavibacteriota bacterium]